MNGKWSIPIKTDRFFREAGVDPDRNQRMRTQWLEGVAIQFHPIRLAKAWFLERVSAYRMKKTMEECE